MRSKEEILDLIYKDLHEVLCSYENKQERRKQGKQYKTDPFDGRRQNGGWRKDAGAKPESMKDNINACKTFLDFDLEKRYGISKGSMLETEIMANIVSCVWLILTREGATIEEVEQSFKQLRIQFRISNRHFRMLERHLGYRK